MQITRADCENTYPYGYERKKMVITFDFDSTLVLYRPDEDYGIRYAGPNTEAINALKKHYRDGAIVFVVTSRKESHERSLPEIDEYERMVTPGVDHFLRNHGLDRFIEQVYFTNGNLKRGVLKRLESAVHYDDDQEELSALPDGTRGMQVEFQTGDIKPWSDLEVRYPSI